MSDGDTYIYKIVLIGDGRVGKTSLRRNYMGENFKKSYQRTLKADFAYYQQDMDGYSIKYSIWDLAGQPEFDDVRTKFYQGAFGAILVFDVTSKDTLYDLDKWVKQLMTSTASEGTPLIIAANKMDLYEPDEHISFDEVNKKIKQLQEDYNYQFPIDLIKTSALTGNNVKKAFIQLGKNIHDWKAK